MNKFLITAASLATLALTAPANATAYNFVVDYSGNNIASLAPGSDPILGTALSAGDSFTYTLQATGNGEWTTLQSGGTFPFLALIVNYGSATVDYSVSLLQNASTVFIYSDLIGTCCAHVGTNTVNFSSGLVFDTWVLNVNILSLDGPAAVQSVLPFPGQGPEFYSPSFISFSANAVPEPATWAMMLAGFGAVGFAARRHRANTTRVQFA